MPVESRDLTRVRPPGDHLRRAADMSAADVNRLRTLASELDGLPILPILGAGASFDCGVKTAGKLSGELLAEYERDPGFTDPPTDLAYHAGRSDLGAIADAIALDDDQEAAVEALGLGDATSWPAAGGFEDHFCSYRVLARLIREDLFGEALTFNYDCAFEAGLLQEGFRLKPRRMRGRIWRDHATPITDAATNARLERRGTFTLMKAHGCAARYRERVTEGKPREAADSIILRWSQLLDWRGDVWARDFLADRARRHVLLLLGFSGQDPVIHVALTRVLEEVYSKVDDGPRVIVADPHPDTLTLRMLVDAGRRGARAGGPKVTQLDTADSGLPATLLVLLVELLAGRLPPTVALPATNAERVALLAVAVPFAMRWSFLLGMPQPFHDYAQRIHLEEAAQRGYAPVSADLATAAAILNTRGRLRRMLGISDSEKADAALAASGFVVAPARGKAYLPTGLPHDAVLMSAGSGGQLVQARRALPRPQRLDCILVNDDGGRLAGVSIDTGAAVGVP